VAARVDAVDVSKAAPSPMKRSRSGQNGIVSAHLGQREKHFELKVQPPPGAASYRRLEKYELVKNYRRQLALQLALKTPDGDQKAIE
jgi:hypothetical protein